MADVAISALTDATTPLAGTEVVPIVQGGTTKKVALTPANIGAATAAQGAAAETALQPGDVGYALTFQDAALTTPTSATTYYFGNTAATPCAACDGRGRIYIPKTGTLTIADVFSYAATAGTAEAWAVSIRLNGTTNTEIASVSASTNDRRWVNSSMSIAVVAGDYVEFVTTTPTWSTPPATLRFNGVLWITT